MFVDGAAELKFNEHFAAGGIEATSNAIGLTVGANVVSVDGAADIAENVNSSGVAMADSMQKKMTSGTVVSSQVDLVELGASTLAHKINSVCSTNDVGKKVHNEKSSTSITYRENFGKNEQSKEMAADPISHGSNTVSGTDNIRENEKDEEMTPVGFSSLGDKLQGKDDAETMMQNADTTAGSPSDETKVEQNMKFVFEGNTEDTVSNEIDHTTCQQTMAVPNSHKFVLVTPSNSVQERIDDKTSADSTLYETDIVALSVDEQKNGEPVVDPAFSIGTPCSIGDVEYKKQGGVSIEDPCEDSMLQGTDDEENKEQNAENIIGPASQMENTSTNEIRAT